MHTLTVELGDRAYPIVIGPALITTEQIAPHIRGRQVLVVTNETVAPLYLSRVLEAVSDFEVATVVLPDGEAHKQLETLDLIFSQALEHRFSRNATVIALGGGVVGDVRCAEGAFRLRLNRLNMCSCGWCGGVRTWGD